MEETQTENDNLPVDLAAAIEISVKTQVDILKSASAEQRAAVARAMESHGASRYFIDRLLGAISELNKNDDLRRRLAAAEKKLEAYENLIKSQMFSELVNKLDECLPRSAQNVQSMPPIEALSFG
jgi:hypothetical protein